MNHQILNYISIHALVKRATKSKSGAIATRIISIHALVKRATRKKLRGAIAKKNFNPRPRKEGDTCIERHVKKISLFQSTPS